MFTGIIEEVGTLKRLTSKNGKKYLTIEAKIVTNDIKLGDSVASNGICLTVTAFDKDSITVEVMNETIQKTSAKDWTINNKINLERALLLSNRLDGHIVQGHVDTVSHIARIKQVGDTKYISIAVPRQYSHLLVPQGSIAVNGISLTVAKLDASTFDVALISFTEGHTNLSNANVADRVNLEFDIIGKYLYRFSQTPKLTKEWLDENNF